MDTKIIIGLVTALGIGLLMGAERERSQTAGADGTVAGVRTYALTALLGATAALTGSNALLVVFALLIGAHSALAYYRSAATDPGLTSEVALLLAYLLGAYAPRNAAGAAAIGVVATILLAARSWLHGFVRERLSRRELHDALLLGACALVILPLLPDRTIDPWQVLNPRTIWKFAVVLMAINGLGYVALRTFGTDHGLALAGLASGFVSSSATHAAMGARSRDEPQLLRAAVAAAALSSVATSVQLAAIVGVLNAKLLLSLVPMLAATGLLAAAYGAAFLWHALQQPSTPAIDHGRAFSPRFAVGFAVLMSVIVLASALAQQHLGTQGALISVAVSGFVDAHAAAASVTSLHNAGLLDLQAARLSIIIAYTTNLATKITLAYWSGGAAFGHRLLPAAGLMLVAAWIAGLAPGLA